MIKKIQHITFPASDLKKTIDFYENVLGLKKTGEWGNYVIFDVGGVDVGFEHKGSFSCSSSLTTSMKPTEC